MVLAKMDLYKYHNVYMYFSSWLLVPIPQQVASLVRGNDSIQYIYCKAKKKKLKKVNCFYKALPHLFQMPLICLFFRLE